PYFPANNNRTRLKLYGNVCQRSIFTAKHGTLSHKYAGAAATIVSIVTDEPSACPKLHQGRYLLRRARQYPIKPPTSVAGRITIATASSAISRMPTCRSPENEQQGQPGPLSLPIELPRQRVGRSSRWGQRKAT